MTATPNTTESVTTSASGATSDRIAQVHLSLVRLPLDAPISDAKVLTGRQKPLTEVALLVAEISTEDGHEGLGFSYSKRAGGAGLYAHAEEIAPELIGEDPNDIDRLWRKLVWAGASVGRSGLATQAVAAVDIALWDLKARRAQLPLAKLLGAHRDAVSCYNTSGGFLSAPVEEILENTTRCLERGIGGVKIKVGTPDATADIRRVEAVREHLGDHVPLMVDANQQWDRATARRICRALERFELTWIEEPLDAHDTTGHAALVEKLDTPVATGEMLTSVAEHEDLVRAGACGFVQPDAPRVGGITPFLRIAALADQHHLDMAPHFAMEMHLHLAAAYPRTTWVEHFEWLEPLFNERLELREGRMLVPNRPGLGLSLSEQCRAWTTERTTVFNTPFHWCLRECRFKIDAPPLQQCIIDVDAAELDRAALVSTSGVARVTGLSRGEAHEAITSNGGGRATHGTLHTRARRAGRRPCCRNGPGNAPRPPRTGRGPPPQRPGRGEQPASASPRPGAGPWLNVRPAGAPRPAPVSEGARLAHLRKSPMSASGGRRACRIHTGTGQSPARCRHYVSR